ncbi:MAG: type III-A CRISPR-associated RAMP protein Csm5 [Bryobacteraceae bacterium]
MKYRLTCLTPLLVGDGRKLSPIDYMVWRDHVNVLDQTRIFRLLAKGTRLENYLTQIRKAEKLDFASWGGFAQNFADRRIPFEDPAYTAYWQRARADQLSIPTFTAGPHGPYLPAAALKGALRTALASERFSDAALRDASERLKGERIPRNLAQYPEQVAIGQGGADRMRALAVGDSAPVAIQSFKIYLLRVATLQSRQGRYELGWKQTGGSTLEASRVDDSTPIFAEMASPGSIFEGRWTEKEFLRRPEVLRMLHWKEAPGRQRLFEAANHYAEKALESHQRFAEWTGLSSLFAGIEDLASRLAEARSSGACIFPLGWGTGLLGKTAVLDSGNEAYREILRALPQFGKAARSGLPIPKTRRIVFCGNRPSALPGWVRLEVSDQ